MSKSLLNTSTPVNLIKAPRKRDELIKTWSYENSWQYENNVLEILKQLCHEILSLCMLIVKKDRSQKLFQIGFF